MSSDTSESQEKSFPWKLVFGAVILIGLFASYFIFDGDKLLEQFINWIKEIGFWGPVIFVVAYALLTVFMIPGSVLTIGAGFAFGLGWGALWAALGANLGANLSFFVGRYFARDKIQEKIAGSEKFTAIDEAVANEGWKIVALTRLVPVFPFTVLNYLYSLTKVKWITYAVTSVFAMLPGTLLYVYLGTIGRFAADGVTEKTTGEKVLFGFGLVATLAVVILLTKKAKSVLQQKTGVSVEEKSENGE